MYRHSYSGDDYYFIYRHIKHIRKYYQVVDSGDSVSTHSLEDSLRSIETASCLHIGYFEAFGLDDILDIITCCLYVDYRHREQLLSLYYDKTKTPPAYIQTVFIICMDHNTKKVLSEMTIHYVYLYAAQIEPLHSRDRNFLHSVRYTDIP